MHVMGRGVAGSPHPSQYSRHIDGPHYAPTKGSLSTFAFEAQNHPHARSAPKYVPRSDSNTSLTYQHSAGVSFSPTWLNTPLHNVYHAASISPPSAAGALSQSFPSAMTKQQATQQSPKPRQGRYSVTNLDFNDFQAANDVAGFLRFLRLHKYIEMVEDRGITFTQLVTLSEAELADIGFQTVGARTRLVKGIERYHAHNAQRGPSAPGRGLAWSGAHDVDVDAFFDGDVLADEMLRYLSLDEGASAGALLSRIIHGAPAGDGVGLLDTESEERDVGATLHRHIYVENK